MVLFDNTQKDCKKGFYCIWKREEDNKESTSSFYLFKKSFEECRFSEIAKISKWEANFYFLLIETTFGMYNNFENYLALLEAPNHFKFPLNSSKRYSRILMYKY